MRRDLERYGNLFFRGVFALAGTSTFIDALSDNPLLAVSLGGLLTAIGIRCLWVAWRIRP